MTATFVGSGSGVGGAWVGVAGGAVGGGTGVEVGGGGTGVEVGGTLTTTGSSGSCSPDEHAAATNASEATSSITERSPAR